MNARNLEIEDVVLLEPRVFRDERGFFLERFNQLDFSRLHSEFGVPAEYVQDNHSRSAPGVLRGLHVQEPAQGKLISVVRGRIWDVAVDLRQNSTTFGKHIHIELDDRAGQLLWIPPGFAHGFCVVGNEPADVLYKVTTLYNPSGETGIHWADPELDIRWPITAPLVSPRDQKAMSFEAFKKNLNRS